MAEFQLTRLGRDSDTLSCLRGLLVPYQHDLFRLRDAQVVTAVASLLAQQRLVLYEGTRALQTIGSAGAAPVAKAPPRLAPTAPPPRAGARAPSPPPAVAPQADTGLEDVAQDEQAATLIAAAREGVPFCEICEKARLAAQAATPELEPA